MTEEFITYPDRAGFKGSSETGLAVAADINEKLGRLQTLVRGTVRHYCGHGVTPEEASVITGIDRVSLQPRFSELKAKGLIVDSGKRRPNPSSGKMAIVYVLPEYGPKAVCEAA